MKKFKFRTYLVLTLVWLGMIFLQSFLPSDASYAESSAVLSLVHELLPWVSHALLRRAAHFFEFALLGVFMTNMFRYARHFNLFKPLFFTLIAAISDETIKRFAAGRTPQIDDIWLDFLGAAIGTLIVWAISRLRKN